MSLVKDLNQIKDVKPRIDICALRLYNNLSLECFNVTLLTVHTHTATTIATFKCKPKQHLFFTSNIKIAHILPKHNYKH